MREEPLYPQSNGSPLLGRDGEGSADIGHALGSARLFEAGEQRGEPRFVLAIQKPAGRDPPQYKGLIRKPH